MPTYCPMATVHGARFPLYGDIIICPDNDCRVTEFAATWRHKQAFLRKKMWRGEYRYCPKCGMKTDLYFDGQPVCKGTGCRVIHFSGGLDPMEVSQV